MSKKTILEISLYAQYYKKNIRDRYTINNKSLIITNDAIDILDKPQEKLYIEPWTKKIERDEEIKRLNNIINETREEIDNWEQLLETGLRKNSKKICISTAKNMLFFIKSKLEGEK